MKEELQGKLVEILTSMQTAAGKASDFAMSQLPDIAQSYVIYGRALHVVILLVGVALLLGAAAALYWAYKRPKTSYGGLSDSAFGAGMLAAMSATSGIMLLALHLPSAMLVWFAPKVWLLKEIAGMLK